MKNKTIFFLLPCLLFIFLFSGCARQRAFNFSEIKVYRSGDLLIAQNNDIPPLLYVNLKDVPASSSLPADVSQALKEKNFELAAAPSEAGYILLVNIVRKGTVDPAVFAGFVEEGYGADSRFSGHGGTGILADALLVQRNVPKSSKPGKKRLKNITSRNARESSQMRLGLIVPGDIPRNQDEADFFSKSLAQELGNAIAPQNVAMVVLD